MRSAEGSGDTVSAATTIWCTPRPARSSTAAALRGPVSIHVALVGTAWRLLARTSVPVASWGPTSPSRPAPSRDGRSRRTYGSATTSRVPSPTAWASWVTVALSAVPLPSASSSMVSGVAATVTATFGWAATAWTKGSNPASSAPVLDGRSGAER